MQIGEKVRTARRAKGMTQAELAKKVGVAQATVDKIERGISARSRHLPDIAAALGIPLSEVDKDATAAPRATFTPTARGGGIPVYPTSETTDGLKMEADPYRVLPAPPGTEAGRGSYGLMVASRQMAPVLMPRDVAFLDPHIPPRSGARVALIEDTVLGRNVLLCEYLHHDADTWLVRLFGDSPREEKLQRARWQVCHCIVAVSYGP